METPWVAGKKYTVTCVAPDAKPEAEITLYKGESAFNGTHCDRDGQSDRLEQRPTDSYSHIPHAGISTSQSLNI